MKIKINIKKSNWKELEKLARRLRKKSGYSEITAEKITQFLIEQYIKEGSQSKHK